MPCAGLSCWRQTVGTRRTIRRPFTDRSRGAECRSGRRSQAALSTKGQGCGKLAAAVGPFSSRPANHRLYLRHAQREDGEPCH